MRIRKGKLRVISLLILILLIVMLGAGCGKGKDSEKAGSTVPSISDETADLQSYGGFTKEQIDQMKRDLKIPDGLGTEVRVGDEASYWEGAGIYIVYCEFLADGKVVASAYVDQKTGQLARDIMSYSEE
jgi:hypothetical protein